MMTVDNNKYETRQERREQKRKARKSKMTHHGKSIALVYKNIVAKKASKQ